MRRVKLRMITYQVNVNTLIISVSVLDSIALKNIYFPHTRGVPNIG